jgi:ribosomal protein S18 acetylase RimI-like enzyme
MSIRRAKPVDVPGIISLMRDFAEFEKLLENFEITKEKLSEVLFGEDAFVQCMVAEDSGDLAAYAIFYPSFASFRCQRGMYLEDLYVSSQHRGRRLGETMLCEIAKIAAARGFERIDFQVLDWNKPAIDFYVKHGAVRDDVERHFKFTDQAFRRLSR